MNIVNTPNTEERDELFTGRTMNEWLSIAASKPVPMRLFGDFWSEGELGVLFADTAAGKSALGIQIAESICSGEPIAGFEMEAHDQPVAYFDFELTEMQLQRRYAVEYREEGTIRFEDHYKFHPGLHRFEITDGVSRLFEGYDDWEDELIHQIETSVIASGSLIVIIDNVTYLSHETDRGKFAVPLMQRLNDLKKKHSLSILVLAHTPKRDETRPISTNDLAGSKSIANFADSVFAIGKSKKDSDLRYLKQIKARSTNAIYDEYNVAVCVFEKKHNFLGFTYLECTEECEHLAPMGKIDRSERIEQVKVLLHQGKTQRQVAEALGIGVGTVNNYSKL